jgi:hypothetical protein
MVEQIQKATGKALGLTFNTISAGDTPSICVKSLAPVLEGAAPREVVVVLQLKQEAKQLRKDVGEPEGGFLEIYLLNNPL